MSGTKEGARKGAATNKKKYGDDFYAEIGAQGGSTITENTKKRGFASMSKERLLEISSKGGTKAHEKKG